MRRQWVLAVSFVLALGWCAPAQAQLAVIDAANFTQNLIQAGQAIIMVANQVLELTGLDTIALGDDYQGDLDALGAIVTEARGLSYDLGSLQAQITTLFSLESAPRGTTELRQRLAEIRRVVFESYSYAMRTQTLMQTTLSTVRHLTRLISAVGDLLGNMQSNQTLIQYDAKLTQMLSQLQVQTAAYERAQSVERMERLLVEQSMHNINEAIMEDYP